MSSWIGRWLPWTGSSAPQTTDDVPPPAWTLELRDRVQTVARAQSKLSLSLDEVLARIDGLRPSGPQVDPAPVLDALDRLDDARRTLLEQHPEIERGLAGISARLEGFLGAMGVERWAEVGVPVNASRFRVVGVEPNVEMDPGLVVRVVRSAAVRGNTVIREGEVLVNGSAS